MYLSVFESVELLRTVFVDQGAFWKHNLNVVQCKYMLFQTVCLLRELLKDCATISTGGRVQSGAPLIDLAPPTS